MLIKTKPKLLKQASELGLGNKRWKPNKIQHRWTSPVCQEQKLIEGASKVGLGISNGLFEVKNGQNLSKSDLRRNKRFSAKQLNPSKLSPCPDKGCVVIDLDSSNSP